MRVCGYGLVLSMLLAAPAQALEFRRLKGSADGEDAQQWLYFGGEAVQFALAADPPPAGQSERYAVHYRSLALFLTDGRAPEDLEPSPIDYLPGGGLKIDPEQVWLDRGERLIALRVADDGGKPRWQLVDAVNGKQVLETGDGPVPAAPRPGQDALAWPAPLPEVLARYDGLRYDDWRGVLTMPARMRVQNWRTTARASFDRFEFAASQADLQTQVDEWLAAQPPESLGDGSQLLGDWRVRSIQARTGHAVYDYPWFQARIRRDPRGALGFIKSTGSQRRSGLLLRDREQPGRLVFAGTTSVNDQPTRDYSTVRGNTGNPRDESSDDSVGEFILLSEGHAVLILDVDEFRLEIYELRR
jgi:hypothetical protein